MKPSCGAVVATSAVAFLTLSFQAWSAEVPEFQYVDLGDTPNQNFFVIPTAINEAGEVAGVIANVFNAPDAFKYSNGVRTILVTPFPDSIGMTINARGDVAGFMGDNSEFLDRHGFYYTNGITRDIGALMPNGSVDVTAMNDAGQITGSASINGGDLWHAFLFEPATGAMKNLGSPGGSRSEGAAINSSGMVVGNVTSLTSSNAFIHHKGVSIIIAPGMRSSVGSHSLNDAGYVAGTYQVRSSSHAFLWYRGKLTDLGTLGGSTSFAFAINAVNQVIGRSTTKLNQEHLFLHDGKMHDISALAIAQKVPGADVGVTGTALNSSGSIALAIAPLSAQRTAAVYKKGRVVVLHPETLLKDGETVRGADTVAINDFGQVTGTYQDAERAYIATPISLLFQRLWNAVLNFPAIRTTEGAAWTAYASYDVRTSDAELAKFIRDVQALIAQKKVSAVLGGKWVADAQDIRAAMNP